MVNQLLISTTGSVPQVTIDDLGARLFEHPVVDKDLGKQVKLMELAESADLQAAITSGAITAKDGSGNSVTNVKDWAFKLMSGSSGPGYAQIILYSKEGEYDTFRRPHWRRKGFGRLDVDAVKGATLTFRVQADGCGCASPCKARLWDTSRRVVLAEVDIGGTEDWYSAVLTNLPESGVIRIEFQVRSCDSRHTLKYYWAMIEVK